MINDNGSNETIDQNTDTDSEDYRKEVKDLIESEMKSFLEEQLISAEKEMQEETQMAIQQLVEETKHALRVVVEEEKKTIWARLEDLRASITRMGLK